MSRALRVPGEDGEVTRGPGAFFRAAGEPAPERVLPPDAPPDMAKVGAAAERFGVEILGPPPSGA